MLAFDQIEVYVTPTGLGRAAIVRRSDGLFCIYLHWLLSQSALNTGMFAPGGPHTWAEDTTPLEDLYKDIPPEDGLYGTLNDARRAVRSLRYFPDAVLLNKS
jgi:hypothetical protein